MRAARFDIQFLRGVAVLAVVAFHAFPAVFPQGFLGVDVFFVVSGFLITGIILKGLAADDFRLRNFLGDFYKRRALRLLPASLVTLAVTTVLAFFILTSSQRADYAEQLLGSLASVANFVLASQTGYFEGAAETKPLLHIWSLSLEEQFYFAAPFVLWATPARYRLGLMVTVLVASLALCLIVMTGPSWLPFSAKGAQKFAFFMLPTRAWELLAGSLCAWLMLNRPGLTVPAWAKYVALAVIPVVCVVGLDPVHPRWDAVIVVLATSVLLLGRDGWLPDMALTRPVWTVGNWSYSLYLIHWPLFSFAFIAWGQEPPWWVLIGLAGLALGLAWLQWKYVEVPCKERLPFRWGAPLGIGAMAVIATFAGAWVGASGPASEQLRPTQGLAPTCDQRDAHWADKPECRTSAAPTVALWGDSYAMHLAPGLEGVPLVQMTKSACAPVQGVAQVTGGYTPAWARECVSFNEDVLRSIEAMPSVRVVILSSTFGQVMLDEGGPEALARTVARINAAGKEAVVIGPTPRARFNAGLCNERAIEGRLILGRVDCNIDGSDPGNAEVHAALRSAGVDFLSPGSVLCASGRCVTRMGDAILYQDGGHLTAGGARFVMEGLAIREKVIGREGRVADIAGSGR